MAIEFKSPDLKDVEMMQEFANIVDAGLSLLSQRNEVVHVAGIIAHKLQEALMWYSHGILNKNPNTQNSQPQSSPASEAMN